jgi:hypothetical protein
MRGLHNADLGFSAQNNLGDKRQETKQTNGKEGLISRPSFFVAPEESGLRNDG